MITSEVSVSESVIVEYEMRLPETLTKDLKGIKHSLPLLPLLTKPSLNSKDTLTWASFHANRQ